MHIRKQTIFPGTLWPVYTIRKVILFATRVCEVKEISTKSTRAFCFLKDMLIFLAFKIIN